MGAEQARFVGWIYSQEMGCEGGYSGKPELVLTFTFKYKKRHCKKVFNYSQRWVSYFQKVTSVYLIR
jgi:hypothetical protein